MVNYYANSTRWDKRNSRSPQILIHLIYPKDARIPQEFPYLIHNILNIENYVYAIRVVILIQTRR